MKHAENEPVTPMEWECLDGTLVFEHTKAYLSFCRDWFQTEDGGICALKLNKDLRDSKGESKTLFRASEAEWTALHEEKILAIHTPNEWMKERVRLIGLSDYCKSI